MAERQSGNWISQQRVDIPDLRAIDSGSIFDMKSLLKCFIGTDPYVLSGFTIPVSGISGPATSLQLVVANSAVWIPGDGNGTMLRVESGTPNEVLSTANTKVVGSFSPGTNYVSIKFSRQTDPTTNDLVSVWDVDSQSEFTKTAPRGLVLNYQIVIDGTSFGNNAPIAIVQVSGSTVTSIENCKTSPFRLGRGGAAPNPAYSHTYSVASENPLIATSNSDPDPFAGGDWELIDFKLWMDAVMTEIKNIKGSAYWYSMGSSLVPDVNLSDLFFDAAGSVITGAGVFTHSTSTPGLLSWTSPIIIESVIGDMYFRIATGNVTIADKQTAYISLVRNQDFQPANTYTFLNGSNLVNATLTISGINIGDWVKAYTGTIAVWRRVTNIVGTQITLDANYTGPNFVGKAVRSVRDYTVSVANPTNVPANGNTYWIAKRDDNNPTTATITAAARISNVLTFTAVNTFVVGQTVIVTGMSPADLNGIFDVSTASGTNFTVESDGPDEVSTVNGSAVTAAQIYLRGLAELKQGEERQIDDTASADTLRYIGAKSQVDGTPDYSSYSSGSLALPNYNGVVGENLTMRLSKVTAMLADTKQDFNVAIDEGAVTWDGTSISITGAQLSIPGTTIGAAPVSINTYPVTALAVNSCVYVDISRSVGSALTLAQSTLALLTPSQQRLVVARNIGGSLLLR